MTAWRANNQVIQEMGEAKAIQTMIFTWKLKDLILIPTWPRWFNYIFLLEPFCFSYSNFNPKMTLGNPFSFAPKCPRSFNLNSWFSSSFCELFGLGAHSYSNNEVASSLEAGWQRENFWCGRLHSHSRVMKSSPSPTPKSRSTLWGREKEN